MLPAPARIAAMPSPNSRECWNPAVPPPPVAGATVGTGLAVGLEVGVVVGLGLDVGLRVVVGLADAVAVGLALPLALAVGVGDPDAPGEMAGGVAEGVDPEHADRATEPIIAKAAKTTVDLALRPFPIVVVRILYVDGSNLRRSVDH
jgi:hypothetical protein